MVNLQAKEKEILNKYLDAGQQLSLFLKLGELATMKSQRELLSAQTRKAIAEEIEVSARARGLKISNYIAEQTADRLIIAANEENRYRGIQSRSAAYWAPVQEFYKTGQMSADLKASEIANIMAEFERYTKDTPGNRWIQRMSFPFLRLLVLCLMLLPCLLLLESLVSLLTCLSLSTVKFRSILGKSNIF